MLKFEYDLLVYGGLLSAMLLMIFGMLVLRVPHEVGVEIRKIRLSAATLLGILTLLYLAAILYFVNPEGPGKVIFDKLLTALTPLAGAIIGFFTSTKLSDAERPARKSDSE